jgi:uncharacterized protein YndB with AHSA1/START domain
MTVSNVVKDEQALTLVVSAEFDAPIERVWQLIEDPRQLERWWGPPEYPATFVVHDLSQGGKMSYYMTGPDGDRPHGFWRVIVVDKPRRLEFENGFADDAGHPVTETLTMYATFNLTERSGGGTLVSIESKFPSTEAMAQVLSMGMQEGMTSAVSQMDAILVSM